MNRPKQMPSRKVVTREVILLAIGLALLGFVVLRLSFEIPDHSPTWRETLRETGTTLIGLGFISVVWDLFARRAFMKEVLDSVDLAEQVEEAGLQQIAWNYNLEIPWGELMAGADRVDIFVSYAATWRRNNHTNLERLTRDRRAQLRVVLPDPEDSQTVAELARRFDLAREEVVRRIREAVSDYHALRGQAKKGTTVECYYVACCPQTAMYIFPEAAVFSLFSHQKKRVDVPTFMVEAGKPVYAFLRAEFDALVQRARPADAPSRASDPSADLPELSHAPPPSTSDAIAG